MADDIEECGYESFCLDRGPTFGKVVRCTLPDGHEGDCRQDAPGDPTMRIVSDGKRMMLVAEKGTEP